MTMEDLVNAVKKLQYQVTILGQAVDYERFPIEALILQFDWGPGDIDKVHNIFEIWDRRLESGEAINRYEFEKQLKDALGLTYQALKSVILSFYENGQWTNVCEAYVDSFGASASVEYHRILRRER